MKQRGFTTILIILLVLITVGGAYYLITQKDKALPIPNQISSIISNTDLTAKWKTYTNTKYGYSIKYPSDFVTLKTSTQDKFSAGNSNYSLLVESNLNISDFESWIDDIKSGIREGGSTEELNLVDNKEAYFQSRMSAEGIFERNIFVVLDKSIIWISFSADTRLKGNEEPEIYSKVEDLADQILATFKFTQ